jgi:hypothetical protein
MNGFSIRGSKLPYTKTFKKEYRDLRQVEIKIGKRLFRVSINGIYRQRRSEVEVHRRANPGWSFGFEWAYVEWVHFGSWKRGYYHGPIHLGFQLGKRGVTFTTYNWKRLGV